MDRMISNLMADRDAMEFTEIITRDELQTILQEHKLSMSSLLDENTVVESGALMGVHMLVTGRINQISCDIMPVTSARYSQVARVVTGSRQVLGRNGKPYDEPVWGDVQATVTKFTKEAKDSINGSYRILDVRSGQVIDNGTFTEHSNWSHSWATYAGDERAIGKDFQGLVYQTDKNPPTCNEQVNGVGGLLAQKLSAGMATKLKY